MHARKCSTNMVGKSGSIRSGARTIVIEEARRVKKKEHLEKLVAGPRTLG